MNDNNRNYLINEHKAGEYWEGIEYDVLGFPIFEPFAVYKHQLDSSIYKKSSQEHMKHSTMALYDAIIKGKVDRNLFTDTQFEKIKSSATKITGYTWHHSQRAGLMMLIPENVHNKARHTGGNSIWGSGD